MRLKNEDLTWHQQQHCSIQNAKRKLIHKGADLIVANDISRTDIGFDSDDNEVTLISHHEVKKLAKASKRVIAQKILHEVSDQYNRRYLR